MQFNINKILLIGICLTQLYSCNNKKEKADQRNTFLLSETEMIEMNDPGVLLEYAIYDTSKVEFVKSIICDTLSFGKDYVFRKVETTINDSSYFLYDFQQKEYINVDYVGMIYFDAGDLDTFAFYTDDRKYPVKDFGKVLKEICDYNKCSLEELIKYRKVGEYYIPNIYVYVEFNSMSCDSGFIEKAVIIDHKISSLFSEFIRKELPDDTLLIKPYIEFYPE